MTTSELKVRAAIWLHNYRQFGRVLYLNEAIRTTKLALASYLKEKRT